MSRLRDHISDIPVHASIATNRVHVHVSNAWHRAAGNRIHGARQQYRNWLNGRARERGRRPLPDRVTTAIGSRTPGYRNRVNPATGHPRRDDVQARIPRRDARADASIATATIERHRDNAASRGLAASREHYDTILADRARRAARIQGRRGRN